jgi:hypothetical protein
MLLLSGRLRCLQLDGLPVLVAAPPEGCLQCVASQRRSLMSAARPKQLPVV